MLAVAAALTAREFCARRGWPAWPSYGAVTVTSVPYVRYGQIFFAGSPRQLDAAQALL